MAFADPISLTFDGVAYNCARISTGVNSSVYYKNMGSGNDLRLSISSQYGRRTRRVARLDVGLIADNPFATGLSAYEVQSYYMVFDTPATNGVIDADNAVRGVKALGGFLSSTTYDNSHKILSGEN